MSRNEPGRVRPCRARHRPADRVTNVDVEQRDAVGGAPRGGGALLDLSDHREVVVRRLLDRGVTATTLRALLPDWDGLIVRVATPDAS